MLAPGALHTAEGTLKELRDKGFRLELQTRVEVYETKNGALPVTLAGSLSVSGPQPLSDELREAIKVHTTQLKAAVAVSEPPVPWLGELVRRYLTGAGTQGHHITLNCLTANVASFLDLDPVEDVDGVRSIIAKELTRKELSRKAKGMAPTTTTVTTDDDKPRKPYKKEMPSERRTREKEEAQLMAEYDELV